MKKIYETEEKLTSELAGLRQRVAELETLETERKRAEEALRLQAEIMRNLVEGVVLTRARDATIVYTNPRFEEMFGYGSGELIGRNISVVNAPTDKSPEEVAKDIQRSLKERGVWQGEVYNIKKDGTPFWCYANITTFNRHEYGDVWVATHTDITERKVQEKEYQGIIHATTDGFWIVDTKGHFLDVNNAYCALIGYSREELLNMSIPDIEAAETSEEIVRRIQQITKTGHARFETRHRCKSGKMVDIEISTTYAGVGDDRFFVFARDITERKQAEEALQAEKNKLQSVIDALEYGLTIQDKDYNILYQSGQLEKFFGDYLGEKCYRVYEGKDTICDDCPVKKAFKDGKSHSAVKKGTTPSGEVFFLEHTACPIRDAEGEIVSCLEVTRNVTEREQAEEALQAEKNKLQSVIDAIEYSLTIMDKDHNIIYQSQPSIINGDYYLGEKCYRVFEGRETVCDGCPVAKAFKDGKSHTAERRIVLPSGEAQFLENTASPIRDTEGRIVSCLEVTRDITERKRVEEAVRESEEKYRGLVTNVKLGVFRSTPEPAGRFLEVNPAMAEITGYSRKELLKMNVADLYVNPEERKVILEEIASGRGKPTREARLRKKDGTEIVISDIKVAVKDAAGKVIYFDGIMEDITERKQAEEREKELQQELLLSSRLASIGELAAGVAHQINNPLTGVLGFSQRLLRKSTDEEVSQDLKRIYNEAERAAKVVQNLLTFARRRESHKQYSDINEIVKSALELRAYELKTSNIEAVTDLAPSLPQVMLDFHQIQEVFLNIILNAEQAMTEANSGGRLTIKTEEKKGYIRTTFTDDGPGIPAEHLDKLFDPFFSTRGERGGTGLGLSVCHGIITEHGGRIYAKSKPGKGAAFFVELPVNTSVSEKRG